MNVTRTSRTARLTSQRPTGRPGKPADARLRLTRPASSERRRQEPSWNCPVVSEIEYRGRKGTPSASFKANLLSEIKNLRAFAISLSGSVSLADDLVQESLLRAWSNWEKFQPGTSLRAWLCTILRNIHYSNYRKRAREIQDSDGFYASRLTVHGDQESHLDLEDFRRALARLPAEQREALTLIGASGFSYEEAAAICGVGIGTIKSRLSRARSKLVELLALDEPSGLLAERTVRRAGAPAMPVSSASSAGARSVALGEGAGCAP